MISKTKLNKKKRIKKKEHFSRKSIQKLVAYLNKKF